MTNKILIKTPYDKNTHVQFYFFHITHKSTFIYVLPFISLLLLLLLTTGDNKDNGTAYITFAITALIFIPLYIWITIRQNIKRDSSSRENQIEIINITKDKITRYIEGEEGKQIISWNNIDTIYERENCFYIYTSNEHGFVARKSDFVEGDLETFRYFCNKYLSPNKKGKVPFKQIRKIKKELKNANK